VTTTNSSFLSSVQNICSRSLIELKSKRFKWSEWLNPCYNIIWLEIASFYRFLLLKFPPHY
jgi:hypothetical protein